MTGCALRLARLLPIAACLLAPVPATAEPDETLPADGHDIERSAAMAQGLAAAPGAGTEGRTILLTMAVQGHAQSQYLLGIMHLDEPGMARDRAEAVKWLARAAARRHAGARARLAGMAATGDAAAHLALGLIDRDRADGGAAALHHLRAAAAAGDPQGLLALGILYRTGGADSAVERDEAYAAVLFRGAAAAAMKAVLKAHRGTAAGILGPESQGWLELAAARTRTAQAVPPGGVPPGGVPPSGDPQRPELFRALLGRADASCRRRHCGGRTARPRPPPRRSQARLRPRRVQPRPAPPTRPRPRARSCQGPHMVRACGRSRPPARRRPSRSHGFDSSPRGGSPRGQHQPSRWVRSWRSWRSCASRLRVAIGRASRRRRLIGSAVSSQ